MLDLGGDFVVYDRLLILTDNVDTKFEVVLSLQLVRVGLAVFWRESRAVDEGPVGGLHISNPDLA